jgi:site-specific DNA-methyltransferase (adenine-specific)
MYMAYIQQSKSDKWGTPHELYETLNKEFNFNHDPCPLDWKMGDLDGLTTEWGTSTFCNPPYSNVSKWIQKAHTEWRKGKTIVLLIYAITDTIAFHKYIYGFAELRFIKGRVKFIDPNNPQKSSPAPKASMLVIFKANP